MLLLLITECWGCGAEAVVNGGKTDVQILLNDCSASQMKLAAKQQAVRVVLDAFPALR